MLCSQNVADGGFVAPEARLLLTYLGFCMLLGHEDLTLVPRLRRFEWYCSENAGSFGRESVFIRLVR